MHLPPFVAPGKGGKCMIGAEQHAASQTPSERPMISFMISVVPP